MSAQTRQQPPERREYRPSGLLALDPRAFFLFFDVMDPPEVEMVDGVAVVGIRGPLSQHASWWMDSYADIAGRVRGALDDGARAIVLNIDSPGGDLGGCLDAARMLRSMAREAEVPLLAFGDGLTASAGYALASAADHFVVSDTTEVGSIGVIEAIYDETALNEALGVKVSIIASGERKADYWPDTANTPEVEAAAQERIDELAEVFFEMVAEHRPGLSVEAIRDMEANLFVGATAVERGLADEVGTLDSTIARARGGDEEAGATVSAPPSPSSPGGAPSASAKRSAAMAEENTPPDSDEETPPDEAGNSVADEVLQTLQTGLGLEDEDAVLKWSQDHVAGLEGDGDGDASGDAAAASAAAVKTVLSNLTGRVSRLEGKVQPMDDERIERSVDDAIREGRATPGEKQTLVKLAKSDPKMFAELIDSRVVLPQGSVTETPGPKGASGPGGIKGELARLTPKQSLAFANAKGLRKSDEDALKFAKEFV